MIFLTAINKQRIVNNITMENVNETPIKTKKHTEFIKYTAIFILGGAGYAVLEVSFRGYTHWSMVLTGGACMLTFYFLNSAFPALPITIKALIGAAVVTLYELTVGCIVNLWFDLGVWDYSGHAFSLWGQICPLFSFIWFLLCFCLAALAFFFYNSGSRKKSKGENA